MREDLSTLVQRLRDVSTVETQNPVHPLLRAELLYQIFRERLQQC
jgi:hypothetical protein